MSHKPINLFLIDDLDKSVLQLWWAKKKGLPVKWVEIRRWENPNLFQDIHDLPQLNTSDLHADRIVTVLPEHPQWKKVAKVLSE